MPTVKNVIKLGCLLILIFSAIDVKAQQKQMIEAIEIKGNSEIPFSEIYSKINSRAGDFYDSNKVIEDLTRIMQIDLIDKSETGIFVQAGQFGLVVNFNIVEKAIIKEVKFEDKIATVSSQVLGYLNENGISLN